MADLLGGGCIARQGLEVPRLGELNRLRHGLQAFRPHSLDQALLGVVGRIRFKLIRQAGPSEDVYGRVLDLKGLRFPELEDFLGAHGALADFAEAVQDRRGPPEIVEGTGELVGGLPQRTFR